MTDRTTDDACPACGPICGMREFQPDDWLDEPIPVPRPERNDDA